MSSLYRLCLRIDETGVKLLGGDFVRSGESLLISEFGVSDSGNIPRQQTFSIKKILGSWRAGYEDITF